MACSPAESCPISTIAYHHAACLSRSDGSYNSSPDEHGHGVWPLFHSRITSRGQSTHGLTTPTVQTQPAWDVEDVLTQLIIDYPMACPRSFTRVDPTTQRTDREIRGLASRTTPDSDLVDRGMRRRCSQSPPDTNVRLGWLISKRSIQVTWARPSNYPTSPVHTTSSFQQRLLKMTIQAFYVPTHRDLFIVKLSPRELHLTRSPRRSVFVCGIQPLTCPPPLAIRYWRDNYGLVSFR